MGVYLSKKTSENMYRKKYQKKSCYVCDCGKLHGDKLFDGNILMIMADKKKSKLLEKIKWELVRLKRSPLFEYRQKNKFVPVIGEGDHDADCMFVAEAPGINEAKTGRHFRGQAGKVFDEVLSTVGLERKDVYVTNIVKDKMPKNRNPSSEEIAIYAPFLVRQIQIIQPKVIVTLGKFSTDFLREKCRLPLLVMGEIHGKIEVVECSYGEVKLMASYHPAAALYNPGLKKSLIKDFGLVKEQ